MAKKKVVKEEPEAEVSALEVDEFAEEVAAPPPAKKAEPKLITINVPVRVKINGVTYYGQCKVTEDVAQVILPMVAKKQKSDLRIFTGKNYLVDRLVDNTLVIKEGE